MRTIDTKQNTKNRAALPTNKTEKLALSLSFSLSLRLAHVFYLFVQPSNSVIADLFFVAVYWECQELIVAKCKLFVSSTCGRLIQLLLSIIPITKFSTWNKMAEGIWNMTHLGYHPKCCVNEPEFAKLPRHTARQLEITLLITTLAPQY